MYALLVALEIIASVLIPTSVIIMILAWLRLYKSGIKKLIFSITMTYVLFGIGDFMRGFGYLFLGDAYELTTSPALLIELVVLIVAMFFAYRVICFAHKLTRKFGEL